jgi:hypothetical protein
MPWSAHLLELGGIGLLWGAKFLLAATASTALLIAARWVRPGQSPSRITFRFALVLVQGATIGLVWVSLSNTALLSSIHS